MFKKTIWLLPILLLIVSGCVKEIPPPGDEEATTARYRLVWNDDPATTMTIGWDQLRGEKPVVYFGEEDFGKEWKDYPFNAHPAMIRTGFRGMNTHFARLTELKPDQTYYFVIKDSEGIGERFWFKTASTEPKPFTFIAGGDTKSSDQALEAGRISNRAVSKLRPLFILFNGDFCTGNGTDDERWKLWFDDWLSLTATPDGRLFPIVPIHGNHENGDKTVLHKLFDVPYQGDDEQNIYYSLSLGGSFFHIIVLNSEIDEGGIQREWLEDDLQKHRHFTFKIAGYHKPFYPHTAGKGENDTQYAHWAGLFYTYGLSLSHDADSHMSKITFPLRPDNSSESYQGFIRDDQKGTMYIGEGSWGASPRANNDDKPWTLNSGSFNQVKWIHVIPAKDDMPAHMKIHTVITASRDENDNVVSHLDNVSALS
ncbi:MAG: metallophosphoesterase family protein, partial [Calditrichales bacterium]